jgi:transposase
MVKKAYKYRFYPDDEQVELLAKTFGCVRFVYNEILRYRTDAYYAAKENVSYIGANARLTALKKQPELAFLNEVSSVPLQQCLRHQQASFSNFFAGRAQYPTFKKKNGQQAAEFTYRAFTYKDGNLWQLEYKSNWAGRTFVAIDQWFPSSKRCDCCGYIADKLPLDVRSWTCPKCLTTLDRDINAANNIKRQGMSLIAFGATVIPL